MPLCATINEQNEVTLASFTDRLCHNNENSTSPLPFQLPVRVTFSNLIFYHFCLDTALILFGKREECALSYNDAQKLHKFLEQ